MHLCNGPRIAQASENFMLLKTLYFGISKGGGGSNINRLMIEFDVRAFD